MSMATMRASGPAGSIRRTGLQGNRSSSKMRISVGTFAPQGSGTGGDKGYGRSGSGAGQHNVSSSSKINIDI